MIDGMRSVLPKNAKLIPEGAKLVFKGVIHDIYQWEQEMFDGTYETFEMIKRPDTVKVLAIKDNKIVVIEQEQPGDPPYYDLPAGRHDVETEDELAAAKRELLEETGMAFTNWKLLDVTQRHAKIEQFIYIFLATGFESQTDQKLDPGEKITVQLLDFNEVKQLMADPKARYLPKDLLDRVDSLEELLQLPEYR